jgi:hypothetical protein
MLKRVRVILKRILHNAGKSNGYVQYISRDQNINLLKVYRLITERSAFLNDPESYAGGSVRRRATHAR